MTTEMRVPKIHLFGVRSNGSRWSGRPRPGAEAVGAARVLSRLDRPSGSAVVANLRGGRVGPGRRRSLNGRVGGVILTVGVLGAVLAGNPPAARAYASATVELAGHGYGHGRGMGQWGALGYALDLDWGYEQILDHFYGGTKAGSLDGDVPMTVLLTRFDDRPTTVTQERGQLTTSAAEGSHTALRARRVGPDTFAVEAAGDCGGPWSPHAEARGPVTFSPQAASTDDRTLMVQACEPGGTKRWLRGQVRAVDDGGVQRTVNALGMESYLRGVVPRESPAPWGDLGAGRGMHALRAQAVAARSYAQAQSRSPVAKTCDTTSCQVYGGVAVQDAEGFRVLEHPSTDAAVGDTAGQVRRFADGGGVAPTEYSSSTGGWSSGGVFPAVADAGDVRSPHHDWTASVPVPDIEAAYPELGVLEAVEVTERNGLGDGGGRVRRLTLRGSSASVPLTGPQFRSRFSLRSDWFVVRDPGPPPA